MIEGIFPWSILKFLPFTKLFDLDEIFITITSLEISPVVAVDKWKIGMGKPLKYKSSFNTVVSKCN
jgi:branched-subunit amino acid aminotransferase/4-amino-4-deoxychorismate lyase